MKPIRITKKVSTITEWTNEETKERIQLEADTVFYFANGSCESFSVAAVPFMQMVFDQILHSRTSLPAHDAEERN